MRYVIILLLSALCACKAPSKKVYVSEQREIYSEREVKSSCVGGRINWQFISLDNIYNSDSQAASSLLTRLSVPPKVETNKDTLIINGKQKILFSRHKEIPKSYFMYDTRYYIKDLHNYFIKANKEFSLNIKDSIPYLQIERYLDEENGAFDWEDYTLWQTIPCNGKDLFLIYKRKFVLHYKNPQSGFYSNTEDMHNKSLRAITNKSILAKSNETLPYDKRIDIKTVKYNLIESKYLKGVSEFLCDTGNKLRYLPLPNKGDIYLILVPMDCGDFDYRFYLLSIKNNTIISNLYVEGIWFEPDSDESKEITSFRIDKNFSIKVKTTFIDSSQKVKTYIIRDDGKIIEK